MLEGALRGEGAEALNDALVLQAGLVLELVGAAGGLPDGLGAARDALQSGAGGSLLEDMRAAAAP
jgi:anthranilate phosphoribosyltransferase